VGWDLQFGCIQRETRYGVPIPPGTSSYSDAYTFTFTYSFGGHSGRLLSVGGGVYYPQINTDFLKFVYSGGAWTFLDRNGLTTRQLANADGRVGEDFVLESSDLTPLGLQLIQKAYVKWQRQAETPDDVRLLEKALVQLRTGS
jgi:hypothetical protein